MNEQKTAGERGEFYTVSYRGYTIRQKGDFGHSFHLIDGMAVSQGLVVVKDGCNPMPGATWFQTVAQAKDGIDILIEFGETEAWWVEYRKRQTARRCAPDLLAACEAYERAEKDGGVSHADFRTIAHNAIMDALKKVRAGR